MTQNAAATTNTAVDLQARHLYARQQESAAQIAAPPADVFAYLDDHRRLSVHMSKPSWRMGGGSMEVSTDEQRGQRVGSRIRLAGPVMGLDLSVESKVIEHQPPHSKVWETIGEPRLLVIGSYRMGFKLDPSGTGSQLRVFVDYNLPTGGLARLLGILLAAWYARWCTRMMVRDAREHFGLKGAV